MKTPVKQTPVNMWLRVLTYFGKLSFGGKGGPRQKKIEILKVSQSAPKHDPFDSQYLKTAENDIFV